MAYAGFWKRAVASLVDGVFLTIVTYALVFSYPVVFPSSPDEITAFAINVAAIVVGWLYFSLSESSSHQATLGKRAMGIYVTDLLGNKVTFWRATARHVSKVLSYLSLFIGFAMAAWTERRQALHDMTARCLVVSRSEKPSSLAVGLAVAFCVALPVLGMVAAIAIPAYQDYTIRAQTMAGLHVLNEVKTSYAEAAMRLGKWPTDNVQAGISGEVASYGSTIRSIRVEKTPAVIVTFASKVSMHADNKSIGLYPSVTEGGIHWECRTIDMPTKFLPADCRETSAK